MANRQVSARSYIKAIAAGFTLVVLFCMILIAFSQWARPWLTNDRIPTDAEVGSALLHFLLPVAPLVYVTLRLATSTDSFKATARRKTYPFQGRFVVGLVTATSFIMIVSVVNAVLCADYPPLQTNSEKPVIESLKEGQVPGVALPELKSLPEHIQFGNTLVSLLVGGLLATSFLKLASHQPKGGAVAGQVIAKGQPSKPNGN